MEIFDDHQQKDSSTKSDVFSLGAMLEMMSQDFFSSDPNPGGTSATAYAVLSRDTGHDATALDRLRNKMLAPDPKDRPSLDQVLSSACLEVAEFSVGDVNEDGATPIEQLQGAVAAYSKAVAAYSKTRPPKGKSARNDVVALQTEITKSIARVRRAQKLLEAARAVLPGAANAVHAAQGAGTANARKALDALRKLVGEVLGEEIENFEVKDFVKFEQAERAKQASLREEIAQIHQEPSIAEALAKIELCSRPFVGKYMPNGDEAQAQPVDEEQEKAAARRREKGKEKEEPKEKEKGA